MKSKLFLFISIILFALQLVVYGCAKNEKELDMQKPSSKIPSQEISGSKLFENHCIMCHQDNSKLKEIKDEKDIINAIRNPKAGMPKFSKEEIPDDDAEAIAKYIFYTLLFKK